MTQETLTAEFALVEPKLADAERMLERQREMEERSAADGRRRQQLYAERAKERETESSTEPGRKLTRQAAEPLIKGIQWWLENEVPTGKPGRPSKNLRVKHLIEEVGVETAAYLTIKCVLDGITEERAAVKMAMEISLLITDELRFRKFKKEAKHHFTYAINQFNTTSYEFMSRSLRAQMDILEIDTSEYDVPDVDRVLVGSLLLDLMITTTGLVERTSKMRRQGKQWRRDVFITITPDAAQWITSRNRFLEEFFPVNYPMLCPPLAWEAGKRGGYRFSHVGRHKLVRARGRNAVMKQQAVERKDMPTVYEALNRLQETGWTINRNVLAAIKHIEAQGYGDFAGVPKLDEIEMPPKPQDWATSKDARKVWRKAAGKVRNRNRDLRIGRVPFLKTLNVAELLGDEAVFFFPYNLDFRGRIYPISNYLTPQGDDMQKGLLMFSEGKPLGDQGAFWLAVNGANCLDVIDGRKLSKLSYAERVATINSLSDRIYKTAEDPWTDLWWTEADAPFQFLAFCYEWARFMDVGPDYVCALPVYADGTCNGIQHYCAMFRDEVGGSKVNLTPTDRPSDLYSSMAERVIDLLEQRAADNDELAALWITSGVVDRSLVKQPVMTFAYGATMFGFRLQLKSKLKKKKADWEAIKEHFGIIEVDHPLGRGKVKSSRVHAGIKLLATVLWEALSAEVSKAVEGREWLQGCASVLSDEKRPVTWTVPVTGLPVEQSYFTATSKQVRTVLAGQLFIPRVYTPTNIVAKRKQENAVAPNVIHSLDAACLVLTVSAAAAQGLRQFAMVHDSYGTLPADMETLQTITREQFYRFYTEQDVAAELQRQFAEQAGDKPLPEPPARGALDLGGVLVSPYFFG